MGANTVINKRKGNKKFALSSQDRDCKIDNEENKASIESAATLESHGIDRFEIDSETDLCAEVENMNFATAQDSSFL